MIDGDVIMDKCFGGKQLLLFYSFYLDPLRLRGYGMIQVFFGLCNAISCIVKQFMQITSSIQLLSSNDFF